ncbi:MAG: GNAT family N-acetyltransferase [Pseudomonadota bacterium]
MTHAAPPHSAALRVEPVAGAALSDLLPELAALRIEVFRAYPYLYDGDLAYERAYLSGYARQEGAVVVGAWDGARLVGAATGAPLHGQKGAWARPFEERGYDVREIFYCGESVLSPEYRGRGVGHAFFDHREAHARTLGLTRSTFCGVIRPEDHPARPADFRPLDAFWRKRGYAPLEGVVASFEWREVGRSDETPHDLQFWIRDL